jgi:hypothetical protein
LGQLYTGHSSAPTVTSKVAGGMKLAKAQKINQFLESLKAEGELISEDTQQCGIQSRLPSAPPSDPITVAIEEKINVTVKRDGGLHNFDIQETLALQVLNNNNGFIRLQVIFCIFSGPFTFDTAIVRSIIRFAIGRFVIAINSLLPVSCELFALLHYFFIRMDMVCSSLICVLPFFIFCQIILYFPCYVYF